MLWQLPENFHRDDDLLASALDELPRANHCFEFRHPSWFATPVGELLKERNASPAIGDARPLPDARPTGAIAYLRLHYGHRGRGGNYSETSSTAGDAGSPPGTRDGPFSSTSMDP